MLIPPILERPFQAFIRILHRVLVRRRAPIWLLVSKRNDEAKETEILARLEFYVPNGAARARVQRTTAPSLLDLFRATLVIELGEQVVRQRYRRRMEHIFWLDYESNPLDGWELCRISLYTERLSTRPRRTMARCRLASALKRIASRHPTRAYALGTGPSLAAAKMLDLSDGAVIVCNTIVRDPELWHRLKPDVFVAADAIYHFGHTEHARAFRVDALARLRESPGTVFAYPELFDGVARREFAPVAEQLVPIPMGAHTRIHVDLTKEFKLPVLGNVLNVMLLPIACTLSRSIWLWGFDGRAPSDQLFWANSNQHAYVELIGTLRCAHPAFFAHLVPEGKESSYVETVHGDALDARLTTAEAEGFEFVMMHRSWTPTLAKRTRAGLDPREHD